MHFEIMSIGQAPCCSSRKLFVLIIAICYSCLLHVAADECGDLNSPASLACSTAADLQLLQRKQRRSPTKVQLDSPVAEEVADPHVESRALEGRAESHSNTAIPDREAAADSTPLRGGVTAPRWDATPSNSDNSADQQHPMRRSATYWVGLTLTVLCIPALVLAVYRHYLDKQGRSQQHVLQMQQQRLQEKQERLQQKRQELQQKEEELIHRHQDEQEYRLMLHPQPFPSADEDDVPPPPAPHPVPRPSLRPLPY